MQKKIGKNQNRFFRPFWGRRCWLALSLFFFFLNTAIGFFFLHFLIGKILDFFDDLTKSTLLAGGISKSYGNFEILKFGRRTVGSACVYTRDRRGAWSDSQGFGWKSV
jgi:hypothetical protein